MLADLARPAATGVATEDRPIAFFCAEYGLHVSMPIYAGGLGALAGDILKEASDRALPLVAVGLMYGRGYFRQRIDHTGWQQEYWVPTDPERSPAVLVTTGDDRAPLRIRVPIGADDVVAQVWRVDVGRVALFLLDTDLPENKRVARWITTRLYDSDPATRLAQYVLLGCGGAAALRALGITPAIVHMNEGHAAFAALEMTRPAVEAGTTFAAAFEDVRRRTVFTTHTPVPAGNDTYPADQVRAVIAPIAQSLGTSGDEIVRLGRTRPDDEHEPFGVTQFALRASRAANGVSRRHGGRVARDVACAVARPRGRRRPDRPCHQRRPRPVVGGRADAPPARSPSRRGLAAARGATRRRSRRSTRSRRRSCGRCAASSAACSSTTCATAASCSGSRAATRASSWRPRRGRSTRAF